MVFYRHHDEAYERQEPDPPEQRDEEPDWEYPDDPFEHPLLATAECVSELLPGFHVAGTDTWVPLPKNPQQANLLEEAA